jgi:hypothetical protein
MPRLGHPVHEKGVQHHMQFNVLPVGSLVYVTSYGPFRGLRGTIQAINTIDDELEEPFCFYYIALEGASIKEPIWFAYDEVEGVAPASFALLEHV